MLTAYFVGIRVLYRNCTELTLQMWRLGPIYTSHFSRVEYNSSPRKLTEIALNQRNSHTNSNVEHVASMVHCNVFESSNANQISAA